MTVVLDAYAVIADLRGDPASDQVAELLAEPTLLAAVNAAEVIEQLVRVWQRDRDDVEVALAMLGRTGLEIVDATETVAIDAGRLRAAHYDRRSRPVSMADCFAAATALAAGVRLATSDPHLIDVVRAEAGEVVALPDCRGQVLRSTAP